MFKKKNRNETNEIVVDHESNCSCRLYNNRGACAVAMGIDLTDVVAMVKSL